MQNNLGSVRSDRFGLIVLMGMEEVMGRAGMNAVLKLAGLPFMGDTCLIDDHNPPISYEQVGAIQASLETIYGSRGGRGLAVQAGRASFNYGLRDFGGELGFLTLDFRLLPPAAKVPVGLKRLGDFLGGPGSLDVRLEDNRDQYIWVIERCPMCWERQAETGVCHLLVGFIQEYLYWASGGKFYHVVEQECIAAGDKACKIAIRKQAWD